MCRLYGFRANEPTKVECTLALAQNALLLQSRSDMRGVAHADGWGVAWYADGLEPTLERRDTAAHRDVHFSHVAERVYATAVIAHVRKATVGTPALENTHPFGYGLWSFAHNGTLRAFEQLEPRLAVETPNDLRTRRKGETDSEAVFLWLLGRLAEAGLPLDGGSVDAHAVGAVVTASVDTLMNWSAALDDRPSKLNVVLTDGRMMVASRRNNSLYWLVRHGVHDCELCGIPHVHHQEGTPYRAVLVASEPITHEAWDEVPDGAAVIVEPDMTARIMQRGAATGGSVPSRS